MNFLIIIAIHFYLIYISLLLLVKSDFMQLTF